MPAHTSPRDASPLDIAGRHNRADAMAVLIGAGANLDSQCSTGWTSLHCAAWGRSIRSVELLTGAKADPTLPTSDGSTALQIACLGEDNPITRFFDADAVAAERKRMERRIGKRIENVAGEAEWPACLAAGWELPFEEDEVPTVQALQLDDPSAALEEVVPVD